MRLSFESFDDPIYWAETMPIPVNIDPSKLIRVPVAKYNEAEMAAFDQLPKTLKRAFNDMNAPACFQLLLKGLKFGEITEDQIYLALLARSPESNALERAKAQAGIIDHRSN